MSKHVYLGSNLLFKYDLLILSAIIFKEKKKSGIGQCVCVVANSPGFEKTELYNGDRIDL